MQGQFQGLAGGGRKVISVPANVKPEWGRACLKEEREQAGEESNHLINYFGEEMQFDLPG